ncbi:hypothetical protein ACSU64_27470 [Bacillaceae bacterium C204]|uniref:hypothetical protein n=1 Tax=Neobacillus sp. 204 TaxID=3383351 RepID=UPI0039786AB1
MKKIVCLLTFGLMLLLSVNGASAAKNDNYPTAKEIEVLNQELQGLVDKANKKLADGEKNFEVKGKNLTVGFKEKEIIDSASLKESQLQSSLISIAAIGSKEYQAYVANTSGFNFSHAVSGVFSWNGDYLTGLTAKADLTGVMYEKSHSTTKEGLDGIINGSSAKVGRVTSEGRFKALKYFANYYTTLIVDVYAPTQSYRIVTAKITY